MKNIVTIVRHILETRYILKCALYMQNISDILGNENSGQQQTFKSFGIFIFNLYLTHLSTLSRKYLLQVYSTSVYSGDDDGVEKRSENQRRGVSCHSYGSYETSTSV